MVSIVIRIYVRINFSEVITANLQILLKQNP
jgi:hypothetical protein